MNRLQAALQGPLDRESHLAERVAASVAEGHGNAILRNGVGYDGDSNDANYDAFNHNFLTMSLAGPVAGGHRLLRSPSVGSFRCWLPSKMKRL